MLYDTNVSMAQVASIFLVKMAFTQLVVKKFLLLLVNEISLGTAFTKFCHWIVS